MSQRTLQHIAALVAGTLFGAGLIVARATDPSVVLGFLDWLGDWNPSLLAMMAGAVLVHAPLYRLAVRRARPLWAEAFAVPKRTELDARLLGGAALFGIGWGLSGYCPGPTIVSLASGRLEVLVLLAAIASGMWITARYERQSKMSPSDSIQLRLRGWRRR